MEKNENPFENKGRMGEGSEEVGGWRTEKKKKKRVRKTGDALFLQDPLELFGYNIMIIILSRLDARTLAHSLLVSRSWHAVASSDQIWENKRNRKASEQQAEPLGLYELLLWTLNRLKVYQPFVKKVAALNKQRLFRDNRRVPDDDLKWRNWIVGENFKTCEELWLGKAHIPRSSQVRGLSKLDAYSISVVDGKRTRITREDLCGHAWEFHFNKAAPEYWRNLDPYWKGTDPLMRRHFHPDGSLSADPMDEVWGGHECCYTIVTTIVEETNQIREHYVRINKWPRLSLSRKGDWRWEMSNTIFNYTSVPDADIDGGTGPLFEFT